MTSGSLVSVKGSGGRDRAFRPTRGSRRTGPSGPGSADESRHNRPQLARFWEPRAIATDIRTPSASPPSRRRTAADRVCFFALRRRAAVRVSASPATAAGTTAQRHLSSTSGPAPRPLTDDKPGSITKGRSVQARTHHHVVATGWRGGNRVAWRQPGGVAATGWRGGAAGRGPSDPRAAASGPPAALTQPKAPHDAGS